MRIISLVMQKKTQRMKSKNKQFTNQETKQHNGNTQDQVNCKNSYYLLSKNQIFHSLSLSLSLSVCLLCITKTQSVVK